MTEREREELERIAAAIKEAQEGKRSQTESSSPPCPRCGFCDWSKG